MSNMYGYRDYNGPQSESTNSGAKEHGNGSALASFNDPLNDDDDDMNPLQAGFWLEGDSLAPPCGTAVTTIHKILDLAELSPDDILYDLGCGDGRICLEAFHKIGCRSFGIEVETDLVGRAKELIAKLTPPTALSEKIPKVYRMDLREALTKLLHSSKISHVTEPTIDDGSVDDLEDFPMPTVLILYLLPEALSEIEDQLAELLELNPECRIVCNTWGFSRWTPLKQVEIEEIKGLSTTKVSIYTQAGLP